MPSDLAATVLALGIVWLASLVAVVVILLATVLPSVGVLGRVRWVWRGRSGVCTTLAAWVPHPATTASTAATATNGTRRRLRPSVVRPRTTCTSSLSGR